MIHVYESARMEVLGRLCTRAVRLVVLVVANNFCKKAVQNPLLSMGALSREEEGREALVLALGHMVGRTSLAERLFGCRGSGSSKDPRERIKGRKAIQKNGGYPYS